MSQGKLFKHWPTVLLGVVVAAIMLLVVFTYQLAETESAVVTTLGEINPEPPKPGLHFRWPYPIQDVFRFDNRASCFEGSQGKIEETMTADTKMVLVGIFCIYKISDVNTFYKKLVTVENAERDLNVWMRGAKNATFGRYQFSELINTDPSKVKIRQLQDDIRNELSTKAEPYGISILYVGINTLNLPTTASEEVFNRMNTEREVIAKGYITEGESEATKIRTAANAESQRRITEAQNQAIAIRAQGDAQAAAYYSVFAQNPELAAFLRKLTSLQRIMNTKTTLFLSTDAVPFDIMRGNFVAPALPENATAQPAPAQETAQ